MAILMRPEKQGSTWLFGVVVPELNEEGLVSRCRRHLEQHSVQSAFRSLWVKLVPIGSGAKIANVGSTWITLRVLAGELPSWPHGPRNFARPGF
jgi:hypothetical protein